MRLGSSSVAEGGRDTLWLLLSAGMAILGQGLYYSMGWGRVCCADIASAGMACLDAGHVRPRDCMLSQHCTGGVTLPSNHTWSED